MHPCPRCGTPVIQTGVGRPRKWCSDDCRRRGQEQGISAREIVRERTVVRPERISTERQIARILDDPDSTELLLRTIAHRWRHRTDESPETHRRFAPLVLDLWQTFHAPVDPDLARKPPPKMPSLAAEHQAAIERVLSSPRSIRTVLTRVRDMLDAGHVKGNAGQPILNGVAELMYWCSRH